MRGHIAGTNVPVNMRRTPEGKLQFAAENKNDSPALSKVISDGFEQPLIFTIEDDPPQKEMSRFLCKMALEAFAETFCTESSQVDSLVDEPYLDDIRNYARYGAKFKSWPYSQRRVYPEKTLMRHPETNEWVQVGFGCCLFMNQHQETLFAFHLYGIEFVLNVGGPSIAGYHEWLQLHGGISPIVERLGCRLTVEGEGKSSTYYLHGNSNSKAGLEFDKKHGYHHFKPK